MVGVAVKYGGVVRVGVSVSMNRHPIELTKLYKFVKFVPDSPGGSVPGRMNWKGVVRMEATATHSHHREGDKLSDTSLKCVMEWARLPGTVGIAVGELRF